MEAKGNDAEEALQALQELIAANFHNKLYSSMCDDMAADPDATPILAWA